MLTKIFILSLLTAMVFSVDPCRELQDLQKDVTFQLVVDGQSTQISKMNQTTTLEEIRKYYLTNITQSQEYYFFYNNCLVQQTSESNITIQEVLQQNSSLSVTSNYLEMKRGEEYTIVMEQKNQSVRAFEDCTLHQLRLSSGMPNNTFFVMANLTVDAQSEARVQVKQVVGPNNTIQTVAFAEAHAQANASAQVAIESQAQNQPNKTEMEQAPKDQFGNPIGTQFDLGKDNAFTNYTILIGCFYPGENLCSDIQNHTLVPSLAVKGMKINLVMFEDDFIAALNQSDEAWVISSNFWNRGNQTEFVQRVADYYNSGRGIIVWGDNDPFFYHANLLLPYINIGQYNGTNVTIQLVGNYPAQQTLKLGNASVPGEFGDTNITTGLVSLYEGITICYPNVTSNTPQGYLGELETIATSSGGQPVIMAKNTIDTGRLIIDCGFTKLMSTYWNLTAGTSRYVQNSAVWLLFNSTDGGNNTHTGF